MEGILQANEDVSNVDRGNAVVIAVEEVIKVARVRYKNMPVCQTVRAICPVNHGISHSNKTKF